MGRECGIGREVAAFLLLYVVLMSSLIEFFFFYGKLLRIQLMYTRKVGIVCQRKLKIFEVTVMPL